MIRSMAFVGILLAAFSALAADDPPADPGKGPVDVAKTAEQIVQNAREAGKRLGVKDPGKDTQKIQQEVLDGIDALIRKAQEPPPEQNSGDMNMNMGGGMSKSGAPMNNMGGGMSKQSMGGSESGGPLSRQERRQRAKQNAGNNGGLAQRPQPMNDPMRPDAKTGMNPFDGQANRIEPKGAPPRILDINKEVWGHLPDKMRQEMDLYFRDRFMPRYSELLRQYYSSLSERGGKNGP